MSMWVTPIITPDGGSVYHKHTYSEKSDNDQFRVPGWCDRFSGRLKCQIFPRMSWKVSWIDDARSRLDYEWTLVISATKDVFIFF